MMELAYSRTPASHLKRDIWLPFVSYLARFWCPSGQRPFQCFQSLYWPNCRASRNNGSWSKMWSVGPDALSSGRAVRRICNQLTADATERAGAVIALLKVSVGSEVVQVSSTLAVLRPQVCWTRQRKQWRYCLQFGFCMSIGSSSTTLTACLQVLPNYKS